MLTLRALLTVEAMTVFAAMVLAPVAHADVHLC